MTPTGANGGEPPPLREQPESVSAPLVTGALVFTLLMGAALIIGAYALLRGREGELRPSGRFPERSLRLHERVADVLQQPFEIPGARPSERERQEQELHQFGWVDRTHRIVRIPIEQAMRLIVEGYQAQAPAPQPAREGTP
jgi:hypothetical protein